MGQLKESIQIVEMGLTMLSHASMPLKFWDHCFTQAVYLINKTPYSALPQYKSPHMALFNTNPDYSRIKVFGCLCFPHLRPYNRHKFQNRSSPCVYLGVSPHHKGHKCLDSSGRVFISKDFIFHELQFPYRSLFSSSQSCPDSSIVYPSNVIFPHDHTLDSGQSSSFPHLNLSPTTSATPPVTPSDCHSPLPVSASAPTDPIPSSTPLEFTSHVVSTTVPDSNLRCF
jgi:histone deacetylase 1/2